MTLDEAIEKEKQYAEIKKRQAKGTIELFYDKDREKAYREVVMKEAEEHEQYAKWLEELEQYREIGTLEECRAEVEKQKAKKPIRNDKCTCPSCGTHNEVIKKRRNTVYSDIVYCWHCGQALKIFRSDEQNIDVT